MRQTGPTLFDTVEPEYRCKDCGRPLARPDDRFPEYGQCLACNHAEVARFFIGWLDEQAQTRHLTAHQQDVAAAWRRKVEEWLP
jgi:DNA-directed RNA polymerase subunit RPC12/RpoP